MKKTGPIVLIGFKGCGKSTVGNVLAKKQNVAFADTDTAIEVLHKERKNEKLRFREIHKKHGADYFKALEAEAVKSILANAKGIISLGGGTLINLDKPELPPNAAIFVYITVEKEVLFKRIMADGIPAFFSKDNPHASFEEFFEKREPIYRSYADITVDNTDGTVENVADKIIEKLKNFSSDGQ